MTFLLSHQETYQVKLPLFEGPLDLLLHLIEREELDITKISLAQVTDQYLAYISQLEELRPEFLVDFLVVAAKLLLIKSMVLLHRPEPELLTADEEDPGEALARQLREYKRFKTAAQYLKDRATCGVCSYVRIAPPPRFPRTVDLSGVTLNVLLAAWQRVLLGQLEGETLLPGPAESTITIDDKMALLRHRLAQTHRIAFGSLLSEAHSRLEVIVTFLAILEMFKAQEIVLRQETLFNEIFIEAAPTSPLQPASPAHTSFHKDGGK